MTPNGFQNRNFGGLGTLLKAWGGLFTFSDIFLVPFGGSFLGYFGVKELDKTIIISLNKCNGKRNRYEAKK